MDADSELILDCPCCGAPICAALSWFKQARSSCPHCGQDLTASRFATVIADLEQAMEESVEEMLHGQAGGGCRGRESPCGGGGCH